MLIIYKVEGAEVKRLILPQEAQLADILKLLKLDKVKVKFTVEEIIP